MGESGGCELCEVKEKCRTLSKDGKGEKGGTEKTQQSGGTIGKQRGGKAKDKESKLF